MEELTKADCNGIRHTDARSRNDLNRSLFYYELGKVQTERAALERRLLELDAYQTAIEVSLIDAQDACWDGAL